MRQRLGRNGHTLIELMIVVAIIAFLSLVSIPSMMRFLAKAKRSEAYVNLASLAMAEKMYFAENGSYTTQLFGENSLSWKPEGAHNYTYGFSGSEGANYFTGTLNEAPSSLSGSQVSSDGFLIYAAGDIDGDGKPDILSIDHNNKISIVSDDLI